MAKNKKRSRKSAATLKAARKPAPVAKLPPESEAARDEGPRLIPLPEAGGAGGGREPGQFPMNRYVALADRALKLWEKTASSGKNEKTDPANNQEAMKSKG